MTAPAANPPQAPAGRTIWRGAMYRALAQAFSYPQAETLEQLASDLQDLVEHHETGRARLVPATAALLESIAATSVEELAHLHNRLFAGEMRCSPCETDYGMDAFSKTRNLADIAGFYRAFGLKAAAAEPAPADFIATELDFMSHLALMQAIAEANGWDERAEITKDAQRKFLEAHLGRWTPVFCRELVALDDVDSFYGAAACLCDAFLVDEIALYGVRPGPPPARRASGEPEEVMTCPMAPPQMISEEDVV